MPYIVCECIAPWHNEYVDNIWRYDSSDKINCNESPQGCGEWFNVIMVQYIFGSIVAFILGFGIIVVLWLLDELYKWLTNGS